jgi:hypothetical protein
MVCRGRAWTGQAEIDDLGIAVVPHHDVVGLDIPVHDPGGMGRGQRLGHLADEVHERGQGEPPPPREPPQCLALDQLHDEEGLAFVLFHAINSTNMRMIQGGDGAGFALEPLQALDILGILPGQELEGDAAVEPGVVGLVDDPHATASNYLHGAVVGDGLTDRDGTRSTAAGGWQRWPGLAFPRCGGLPAPWAQNVPQRSTLGVLNRILAMRTGRRHGINSPERVVPPLARVHHTATVRRASIDFLDFSAYGSASGGGTPGQTKGQTNKAGQSGKQRCQEPVFRN